MPNTTPQQPNRLTRHTYKTTVGTFSTTSHATIRRHRILDLSVKRQLANLKAQIRHGDLGQHDLILGRDYMRRYVIDLKFSEDLIEWDGCFMPMHEPGFWNKARMEDLFFHLEVPELDDLMEGYLIQDESCFATQILDSKSQKKYGVGEKEMLSIVETLKEFRTILLGYPVIIHTDHKNLAFDKSLRHDPLMLG